MLFDTVIVFINIGFFLSIQGLFRKLAVNM